MVQPRGKERSRAGRDRQACPYVRGELLPCRRRRDLRGPEGGLACPHGPYPAQASDARTRVCPGLHAHMSTYR